MKRTHISVEHAFREVALRHNTTVEEVRNEIRLAMLAGLCNTDPAVQAKWNKMPCAGKEPTPEELIAYIAKALTNT